MNIFLKSLAISAMSIAMLMPTKAVEFLPYKVPACLHFDNAVSISKIWKDGADVPAAEAFIKAHETKPAQYSPFYIRAESDCTFFDHGIVVEVKTEAPNLPAGKIGVCLIAGPHTRGQFTCESKGWWAVLNPAQIIPERDIQ